MNASFVTTAVPLSLSERKSFRRYRFSAPMVVRRSNVPEVRGMSVEISECGMSVIIGASLKLGETVELEPVGGGAAAAVLQRCLGRLYGFEFLHLNSEQAGTIREMCKMLPPYHSRTLDLWQR
jgi:PilZ domain-containing protein